MPMYLGLMTSLTTLVFPGKVELAQKAWNTASNGHILLTYG